MHIARKMTKERKIKWKIMMNLKILEQNQQKQQQKVPAFWCILTCFLSFEDSKVLKSSHHEHKQIKRKDEEDDKDDEVEEEERSLNSVGSSDISPEESVTDSGLSHTNSSMTESEQLWTSGS